MTDARALRERVAYDLWLIKNNNEVAEEYCKGVWNRTHEGWEVFLPDEDSQGTFSWMSDRVGKNTFYRLADAAIALVLEEAARVIVENYEELCTEHRLLLLNRAAAIRALKHSS